ncbi:hydrogenase maturation nickel metallochaperone HypA (plasmid) [Lichenicola cladoniae]|uniref:Hydrogenase maturation factor HypA n=1 Tax=Lichenicola cladoniae TaxID=1484109 RepID=A0A6M8HYS7_9PROT|nr:hydrogenase maturation nickel metallochaperone HypA [Lichenicola cladoniae]NPD68187.1 hydrogenase maturation nickel metallochaperone HypA [Acetobacteraceae bacterium]QKE93562.1 hydrogenase maturation nickel metallochaperone HypA [Lichenicola cladoniae]
MHEMSLIESVIELVEEERRKQPFSRVRLIRLAVGELGCVEPEALRFCFDAIAHGTIADGALLEIEIVAGEGWCPGCRQTVSLAERFAECPLCANAMVQISAGQDLRLAELEVE